MANKLVNGNAVVGNRLVNGGALVGQQASQQRCCRWPITFSLAAALPLKQIYPEGTVISFLWRNVPTPGAATSWRLRGGVVRQSSSCEKPTEVFQVHLRASMPTCKSVSLSLFAVIRPERNAQECRQSLVSGQARRVMRRLDTPTRGCGRKSESADDDPVLLI